MPLHSIPVIHRYNPFEMRHGSNGRWHDYVQEVIFYGESRLRAAVITICQHSYEKQQWLQSYLRSELVCSILAFLLLIHELTPKKFLFMSYVGIGASIGIQMEVPILLRSLADYFANLKEVALPVRFDLEFIHMLEGGTKPSDPYYVVETYYKPWWKAAMWARNMGPLNETNLTDAVAIYQRERQKNKASAPVRVKGPLYYSPDAEGLDLSIALLHALEQADSTVSALATSAETDRVMMTRRACGFLMLHEASVTIDVEDMPSSSVVAHGTEDIPASVAPLSNQNSQWVHGKTLTEAQVLDLLENSGREKDGYFGKLPDGVVTGEWSVDDGASDLSSVIELSAACDDATPLISNPFPSYFDHNKFRDQDWPVPAPSNAIDDSISDARTYRKQQKHDKKKMEIHRAKERRAIQSEMDQAARIADDDAMEVDEVAPPKQIGEILNFA